jgi:hypothetical protein
MSSMLPPSIILPPETAPDEPFGSQMPTVNPSTGLNPYFDQFNQMQQGFQSTMQDIKNDPFPLLEQYLGQQAKSNIDQTLQPMQQQAQEKISGVMSGIRSLVSEAFPSSGGGGGMSTTGQLGFGGGSLSNHEAKITQPTSPAPFTPAISPSDMGYPAPKMGNFGGDLLGGGGDQSTNDFLTPEQKEQFGITTTNYQGPVSLPVMGPNSNSQTYMGGVPVTGYTPQIGFGGDPNAPQIDYTPEQIGNLLSQAPQSNPMAGGPPMVGGSGMGNPMALSGPPAGFEKAKGLIDVGTSFTQNGQDYTKQINPFTGQPEVLMVDDIQKQQLLEGKNIFAPPIEAPPSMGSSPIPSILQSPDPNNPLFTPPMTLPVSATLDPAMEYNPVSPMPQQDPLINLAYNYNMENSPF